MVRVSTTLHKLLHQHQALEILLPPQINEIICQVDLGHSIVVDCGMQVVDLGWWWKMIKWCDSHLRREVSGTRGKKLDVRLVVLHWSGSLHIALNF